MVKKIKLSARKIYRRAISFGVSHGLIWGRDNQFFHSLTGSKRGESCVIIGMGPSLRIEDLERFEPYCTFACNKIYLAFEQTSWRPTYYSVIDHLVAENNLDAICNAKMPETTFLLSQAVKPYFGKNEKYHYFYNFDSLQTVDALEKLKERKSIANGLLGAGFTVVIDQIQIALLMGFTKIYLVGLDYSFISGKETEEVSDSGKVLVSEGEKNHFHKDYRKKGEKWTVPCLDEQLIAYRVLNQFAKQKGVEIINASRESKLDEFVRVDFDSTFQ